MSALHQVLFAARPHPSLGDHADTYGRVIGSWHGTLADLRPEVARAPQTLEVHFGWVLEGRAVQDVWITPARTQREPTPALDWYGTTVRVFDPRSQSWRVTWFNPPGQTRIELEGRREGDDVVQLGLRQGVPVRWTFHEITAASFSWDAHARRPDGSWLPEIAIRLRRLTAE
jgi:hypothetical protein